MVLVMDKFLCRLPFCIYNSFRLDAVTEFFMAHVALAAKLAYAGWILAPWGQGTLLQGCFSEWILRNHCNLKGVTVRFVCARFISFPVKGG